MELTADALNVYQRVLPNGFFERISGILGLPAEKTKAALMAAIPAVLGAVQQRATSKDGAKNIFDAIHENGFDHPASDPAAIDSRLDKGTALLNRVLGGKTDVLANKVAASSGISGPAAGKLLGAASTAVFSLIGSKMKGGEMSPSAFASVFGAESLPHESTLARAWPWALGVIAVIFGAIWLASRTPTPMVAADLTQSTQSETVTTALPQQPAAPVASDSEVVAGLAAFLSDPLTTAPQTFTLRGLNFTTGSANLSFEAQSVVNEIGRLLLAHPSTEIRIEGHTDSLGNMIQNQQLSLTRAENMRDALITQGVEAERISVAGLGSSVPVADNTTEEGRSYNRRTEIQVVRK